MIGIRASVIIEGEVMRVINAKTHHVSLFDNAHGLELRWLDAALGLPCVVGIKGKMARSPCAFQTAVLLDARELHDAATRVCAEIEHLRWYHTTKEGTQLHVCL